MSKRSRRRRALPSGTPARPPGFGPGEPHWSLAPGLPTSRAGGLAPGRPMSSPTTAVPAVPAVPAGPAVPAVPAGR
ncbi:hypothetical protein [Nonomuraea candida]|uniref:hypothetical protein n=1 Tax=Nonomuraea candida TaxID=359159 RepID=UPI000A6A9561|nr:hypothetical protein [Nonomuraea candida]